MLRKITEEKALTFTQLSPEEKKSKGILCRLYGPVASFLAPTRNGRKYTNELWEKLFNSDLIKERFKNGGIFGELCHPEYEEVNFDKVACIMPEPPRKDDSGQLIAYVDVLDTPCGKVAYQLQKYGYKFGISSRGTGDLIEGPEGEEVDPDSYQLNAFDLVEIPAVKQARLNFTEGLNTNRQQLKTSLKECLEKADTKQKSIMEAALVNLHVVLDEEFDGENCSDKEVVNDKSNELVAEFGESIAKARKLEKDNLSLQEKLSVCNAKEKELVEKLADYKSAVVNLSDSAKEVKVLKEKLEKSEKLLESRANRIHQLKAKNRSLSESSKKVPEANVQKLNEKLEDMSKQLAAANELVNKYRKSYKSLKESYLDLKVENYGLDKNEVKKSLTESYKIKDIDSVCERLSKLNPTFGQLPFSLNENQKIKVIGHREKLIGNNGSDDDLVSDSLLQMAEIK